MIRRPPRSTQSRSSAASDVYKRQELPAPVSSCRHTGQVYCSELLRVFQRRLVAAARTQNRPCYASFSVDLWLLHGCKNRPGQILNLHTHRYAQSTRKISWTDLPRVYHNAQVIYVSGSRVCSCSSRRLPAISRIISLHTLPSRQQGTWKISWTDYASRRNHAQAISVVSYRHTEPRTALLAQNQQPAQPYSPTEIDA